MGFKAPKASDVVQKAPEPLINLGETTAEVQNQRNKKGFLSTFLQGSRNRTAGMLGNVLNNTTTTLGRNNI